MNKYVFNSFALIVFVLAGLAVYYPSLKGGIVFDDLHTLEQNPAIRSLDLKRFITDASAFSAKSGNWPYRPVTVLSYALDWKLGAGEWSAFHLTNILIHSLTAFFIFLVTSALFKRRLAGAGAGLLFLAHPLPGFSVSYLSARSGMLAGLFLLISFWFRLAQEPKGKRKVIWHILSLVFFGLALLSKIDAVAFVIVIAVMLWFSGRRLREKIIAGAPFLVMATGFMVIYKLVSGSLFGAIQSSMIPFHSRAISLLAGFSAPWIYLAKLLFPAPLTIFPALPGPAWALLAASATGSIIVIGIALRRRVRQLWLPLAWYFGAILPLALLRLNILLAWHRGYLALIGLFIGVGLLVDYLVSKSRAAGLTLAATIFAILALASNFQARAWQDPVKLWTQAVQHAPGEFVPRHFLGTLLIKNGDPAQAEKELLAAIGLNPGFVDARNSLGALYFERGEFEYASRQFAEVVRLDPENYIYLENLCIVKLKLGELSGFDELIRTLVRIAPAGDPKLEQIISRYRQIQSYRGEDPFPEK